MTATRRAGRPAARRYCRCSWLLILLGSMAQSQDEQVAEPERPSLQTFADLDKMIDGQTSVQWELREQAGAYGVDRAGKQVPAYAEEFIFTDAVAAELQALRELAARQSERGDEPGLRATLERATAIAMRQWNQLDILELHFLSVDRIAQHEALLAPLLARVPARERERTEARLRPLYSRFQDDLPARLRAAEDGFRDRMATVFAAYNEERNRLAELAARADAQAGRPLPGRDVSRPCTPPYPAPSGKTRAAVDASNLDKPVYTEDARRLAIEGRVILRARVSARGCPERMELLVPLGYEPLDHSALDWSETVRFHPAVREGKPVATTHEFAVTFLLTD